MSRRLWTTRSSWSPATADLAGHGVDVGLGGLASAREATRQLAQRVAQLDRDQGHELVAGAQDLLGDPDRVVELAPAQAILADVRKDTHEAAVGRHDRHRHRHDGAVAAAQLVLVGAACRCCS